MATTSRYRVGEDSVGGAKCLIVYQDERPVCTVWTDDLIGNTMLEENWPISRRRDGPALLDDVAKLVKTVTYFGGRSNEVRDALRTYFKGLDDPD